MHPVAGDRLEVEADATREDGVASGAGRHGASPFRSWFSARPRAPWNGRIGHGGGVAGYITPAAPAGLGVREGVLLAALGPVHGAETAVAITVVLRACTLAADGLGFLAGLVLQQSVRPE